MGLTLFLKTKKIITKHQLCKIASYINRNGVIDDVTFRYEGQDTNNMEGKYYFFDSMWTPLMKPLKSFDIPNVDKFSNYVSIFSAVQEVVGYLLNENHNIKLFIGNFEEKEIYIKKQAKLKFSDIDDSTQLDWGTIYEIEK